MRHYMRGTVTKEEEAFGISVAQKTQIALAGNRLVKISQLAVIDNTNGIALPTLSE